MSGVNLTGMIVLSTSNILANPSGMIMCPSIHANISWLQGWHHVKTLCIAHNSFLLFSAGGLQNGFCIQMWYIHTSTSLCGMKTWACKILTLFCKFISDCSCQCILWLYWGEKESNNLGEEKIFIEDGMCFFFGGGGQIYRHHKETWFANLSASCWWSTKLANYRASVLDRQRSAQASSVGRSKWQLHQHHCCTSLCRVCFLFHSISLC